MVIRDVPVRATTHGKPPAILRAQVADLDLRDRVRRCARAFLPVFGAGCLLLLIPPHLLSFLVCTTIATKMALRRKHELSLIQAIAGPCPDCGVEQQYATPEQLPHLQRCASCGAFVKLEQI